VPWCLGVPVAFAATSAAVWWVGLPALGVLALLLLLGGLILVSLASRSTGGPSEK
jgi:hypothetical protein